MATRSMNKVFILGNLTRDPELRYTAKGTPVCTFGVATNREWSPSSSDEIREDTEFHNVVAWSKLAELCAQLLYKGRKVFIEGRLNTSSWDDAETGKKMYRTEIVCAEMIALGASKRREEVLSTGKLSSVTEAAESQNPEQSVEKKAEKKVKEAKEQVSGEEMPF